MKKRDLKLAILKLLQSHEMHGYELGKRLTAESTTVQLSYLYQVLSEMKREGLIKTSQQTNRNGHTRKVYSVDIQGRRELHTTLKALVSSLHDFYSDYLTRLPPETWLLKWEKILTDTMPEPHTIVFVVDKPAVLRLYQFTLQYYCAEGRDVYLVTDKSFGFTLNSPTLVTLPGSHTEIPLRRDFADIVIAPDPPRPEALTGAIAEFHRVVKRDGVIAIGFPHIDEQADPLTIGAFIERIHYDLKDQAFPDEQTILNTFTQHFRTVRVTKISDFSFYIGTDKLPPP